MCRGRILISRMSYLVQQIHFFQKRRKGLEAKECSASQSPWLWCGSVVLLHQDSCGSSISPLLSTPALHTYSSEKGPGRTRRSRLTQHDVWHLLMPQLILCGRGLTLGQCCVVKTHSLMFLKHSELWQYKVTTGLFSSD